MSGYLRTLLFKAWVQAFPSKTLKICQEESNMFWKTNKETFKNNSSAFETCVSQKINELKQLAAKKKTSMFGYFVKQQNVSDGRHRPENDKILNNNLKDSSMALCIKEVDNSYLLLPKESISEKSQLIPRTTLAQEEVKKKISVMESELNF